MSEQARRIYEFGPFRLDAAERQLLHDGRQERLEPKAFDILLVLVENSGHLVSKEDLMRCGWADSFVEEAGLPRNISTLRSVLGDNARKPRYIETVHKKGYRFVADVRELSDAELSEQAESRSQERRSSSPFSQTDSNSKTEPAQAGGLSAEIPLRPIGVRWKWMAVGIVVLIAIGLAGAGMWRGVVRERPGPMPGPRLPLLTYEFDLVALEAQGDEWGRRKGQAQCYVEDLGAGVKLEMTKIPAGSFMMGTSEAEAAQVEQEYTRHMPPEKKAEIREWIPIEMPQHLVKVPSFFLGKREVTQAQWRAVAMMPKVNRDLHPQPSAFVGDDLPVTHVSWMEAREFCDRLSRHSGSHYRLPSEAEWEYACRAGTTTPFHFGDTITTKYVNYNGKYPYGQGPAGEYRGRTTPVGSFGVANAFGLYDMHGNVWEWCADTMYWTYSEAPADGSAWGSEDLRRDVRVTRGGAYGNDNNPGAKMFYYNFCAFDCRSARRNAIPKGNRYRDLGFRVAMSLEQP